MLFGPTDEEYVVLVILSSFRLVQGGYQFPPFDLMWQVFCGVQYNSLFHSFFPLTSPGSVRARPVGICSVATCELHSNRWYRRFSPGTART